MTGVNGGGKVHSLQDLAGILARLRARGKRVVHCHGVFDLLHIGHIRHFQAARRLGDVLVVTVTSDRHVNKGPHRPAFHENLRAEQVAALGFVDFVAVSDWPTAVQAIRLLKPAVYAKGPDYRIQKDDVTGGIGREKAALAAVGGRFAVTEDITFSSSSLLNRHMPAFTPEQARYLARFGRRYGGTDVLRYLEEARKLKVLVVGEAIIDEYVYCEAIGKSSKDPTLVVKYNSRELFAGGILAVANNVAGFVDRVGVVTFLGTRDSHLGFIRKRLKPNVRPRFLYRRGAPTILKRRYVEGYHFAKLLEVYDLDDSLMGEGDSRRLRAALEREVPRYDAVVVVDYGHGMLDDHAIRVLSRSAKFLAVNAQSNAGNRGFHTVGRYPRPDLVCVAEQELRMEARDRRGDLRQLLLRLARRLGVPRLIVTRGKSGCLCYDRREGVFEVPSFAGTVRDRIGAGDAFLSIAAISVQREAPIEVAGFLGNAAGAQAVATVGHRDSVEKAALFKHLESLLK